MVQIKTFKDLMVWQQAHEVVLKIYQVTKKFPQEERYNLVVQIRRAAISVASNIVEGFNRFSVKDSLHFYNFAKASLEEIKYQLLIARDLSYLSPVDYQETLALTEKVGKMLNAWVKSQIRNTKTKFT